MKTQALVKAVMLLVISTHFFCGQVNAQTDTIQFRDSTINLQDTSKANIDSVAHKVVSSGRKEDQVKATDTIVSYQLRKLREYSSSINGITSWLRRGVDTMGLWERIDLIEKNLEKARRGILQDRTQSPNLRNLKSSLVLISGIQDELSGLQKRMEGLTFETYEWQQQINSLRGDTLMRKVPRDSALASEYKERITEIITKLAPAITQLESLALKLGVYQNRISALLIESSDDIEEIEFVLNRFNKNIIRQEVPYLFEPYPESKSLKSVLELSLEKAFFTFRVYFQQSWNSRLWIIFLFLFIYFSGKWSITALSRQKNDTVLDITSRWVSVPLLASLFIAQGFGQFFYVNAPAIYLHYVWTILLIIGTIIFTKNYGRTTLQFWAVALVLILLSFIENLTVQISQTERWIMIVLGVIGLCLAWLFYDKVVKHHIIELPFIGILLVLFAGQEFVGLVSNVFGRYTLAKIMITGGYFNFINGIVLWWMLILLTEYFYLLFEALSKKETFTPYFDFIKYKKATRPFLVKIVIVFWVVLFLKTLNLYDPIIGGIEEFLVAERSIGNYTFSFRSILIFLAIIIVSSLIARLISFFLSPDGGSGQSITKNKLGGMVLILRLMVLTSGFLLAIAAAGIPLDKITIIIGALGVGIGFGLQTIVNNLVSGIIIAFERPINVGDQIEVGGRLGKVMEIGIRSSKLATFDGAEVIIPNGDLLNQHLVNWTLSSNNRRVEVMVGVKYGTDLGKVKQILAGILEGKQKIISIPEPSILIHQFGPSSIDFRVLFWTNDIGDWLNLKSQIIQEIDEAFKANGIEIPFPQQDIYIKGFKKE